MCGRLGRAVCPAELDRERRSHPAAARSECPRPVYELEREAHSDVGYGV